MTIKPSTDPGSHEQAVVGNAVLTQACDELRPQAIEMLSALVGFKSVLGEEASAQCYMADCFRRLALQPETFVIDEDKLKAHPGYSPSLMSYEGRENVVGVHRPSGPSHGRSLILNGHIDVVPEGERSLWQSEPFAARREGDRLYGRGAADMKAGIVAYTMAMAGLRKAGYEPAAPVYLQSVIEEECTGNGALSCLVEGYTADAAIITEPVAGMISAQMGVIWLRLDVKGVPAHAKVAQEGIGAIEFAHYLWTALKRLEDEWNAPAARHPIYAEHTHPVNFNLGQLHGGEWTSSVSSHCHADLRIGFYPGWSVAQVRADIEACLASAYDDHPLSERLSYEVNYAGFAAEGCVVDMNTAMVDELQRAHADVTGSTLPVQATTGTTDVKHFNLYAGVPATCYGPSGGGIHGIDEWVSIDSMMQVTRVLAIFIARWCGLNSIASSSA